MPDGTIQPAEPKRGPGRPYPPTALQSADPQELLQRYLNDESSEDIARSFGVSAKALNYFLRSKALEEWREAQVAKAEENANEADATYKALQARVDAFTAIEDKDKRQAEIEACRLQLALARARAERAQWILERLLSRLYGQKQTAEVVISPVLNFVFASQDPQPDAKVIDVTPSDLSRQSQE